MVTQAVGAHKVTPKRSRETVKPFPGDLALGDRDDVARPLAGVIEGAEPPAPKPPNALPHRLKRDVDRRFVSLADWLDRGRIPCNKVLTHLGCVPRRTGPASLRRRPRSHEEQLAIKHVGASGQTRWSDTLRRL